MLSKPREFHGKKCFEQQGILLNYYEIPNGRPPLVLLHAQGVDGRSFARAAKRLSRRFHVYSVDCYGHGGSLHDPSQYNLRAIGDAVAAFIRCVAGGSVRLVGHSSGGLIAAYIAAYTDLCDKLILEDPPFFSSQGERRKTTFNYVDLSTACHRYLEQGGTGDFVLYYFRHQYAWNLFPEKNRDKLREKLIAGAEKYRARHPDRDLKVPFWPRAALEAFRGMNSYDPRFGLAFYDDSFHAGISHEELLKSIRCETVFLKAKTAVSDGGLLMAALSEEDARRVQQLIGSCRTVRFDCGHAIHIERPRQFFKAVAE